MNTPFGMNAPNLLPMLMRQRMAPGLIPGPVAPQPLTPGFRAPPTGGAPGIAPQQQGMPGMDPSAMAGLAGAMMRHGAGPNEQSVNGTLDKAPTGAAADPFAQGAAQVADMSGGDMGWLGRMIGRLF